MGTESVFDGMLQGNSPVTRSLSVTERLREMLLRGEFTPGGHLQEMALAEHMQVSRTPIREALRQLAQDGLLIYQPNRGFVVKRFALDDIMQAFQVRAVLEGLAARTLAERGLQDAQRQALQDSIAAGDALLLLPEWDAHAYEQWRGMNTVFHVTIIKGAENALLTRFCQDARKLPVVFNGSFRWYRREDFRRSHDHHHVIFDALQRQEPERADWFMREHIHHAAAIIREHYADSVDAGDGVDMSAAKARQ